MDSAAYKQYEFEQENWLKRGRRNLLTSLIRSSTDGRDDLEILDLGSGVGQNIPALLEFGVVDALEINEIGLSALRANPRIRHVIDEPIPFELDRTYDVVVATDVLEHIADDRGAVRWIAEHLRSGGVFVSTVPAYQFLFGEHDIALHHFRRYTTSDYANIMQPHFDVKKCGYFNSILFPAAASVRLAKRYTARKDVKGEARKQSSVMPRPVDGIFGSLLNFEIKMIERGFGLPFGLSVYCVARKP